MSNLRQAAEDALEAYDQCDPLAVVMQELRAALAEPEQEPVAWRTFDGEGGYDYRTYEDNEDYAAEWAKRNPQHVGWVEPLFTAPPQRMPLTDDAIWQIATHCTFGGDLHADKFARAIEAAHGIKGET